MQDGTHFDVIVTPSTFNHDVEATILYRLVNTMKIIHNGSKLIYIHSVFTLTVICVEFVFSQSISIGMYMRDNMK